MDQAGKYEQLIGEKLEQIPLPDLVEAIWARIETELDSDLPEDDGNDPGAGPRGGIFGGKGLFVFLSALIMTFFFYPNNKNQNIESNLVLPGIETSAPVIKPPDEPIPIKSRANRSVSPKNLPIDTTSSIAPVFTQQAAEPPAVSLDDSIRSNVPSLVVTPAPIAGKDSTDKKKSRGVKGLSDGDYRIVPKKDSGR